MIVVDWIVEWVYRSEMREADRIEREAEANKARAVALRGRASAYFEAKAVLQKSSKDG